MAESQTTGEEETSLSSVPEKPLDAVKASAEETASREAFLHLQTQAYFSGPLPPPLLLKDYDEIVPGSAERIIKSWEVESQHRRQREQTWDQADQSVVSRGQYLAFVLASFIFGGSLYIVSTGYSLEGMAIIIAEITALVGVFLYSKKPATEQTTKIEAGEQQLEDNSSAE